MNRFLAVALIVCAPLFSGCATWPPEGSGGLAELFSGSDESAARADGPLSAEDGVAQAAAAIADGRAEQFLAALREHFSSQ